MHGGDLELSMLKSTFDGFLPESACDDLQLMLSLLRRYVHTFEVYGERIDVASVAFRACLSHHK